MQLFTRSTIKVLGAQKIFKNNKERYIVYYTRIYIVLVRRFPVLFTLPQPQKIPPGKAPDIYGGVYLDSVYIAYYYIRFIRVRRYPTGSTVEPKLVPAPAPVNPSRKKRGRPPKTPALDAAPHETAGKGKGATLLRKDEREVQQIPIYSQRRYFYRYIIIVDSIEVTVLYKRRDSATNDSVDPPSKYYSYPGSIKTVLNALKTINVLSVK